MIITRFNSLFGWIVHEHSHQIDVLLLSSIQVEYLLVVLICRITHDAWGWFYGTSMLSLNACQYSSVGSSICRLSPLTLGLVLGLLECLSCERLTVHVSVETIPWILQKVVLLTILREECRLLNGVLGTRYFGPFH